MGAIRWLYVRTIVGFGRDFAACFEPHGSKSGQESQDVQGLAKVVECAGASGAFLLVVSLNERLK